MWAAAGRGAGDFDHVVALPTVLMKLPDLTLLFPPPDDVVRVIVRTVSFVRNFPSQMSIAALEVTMDVIKNRLINHLNPTIILQSASSILNSLAGLEDHYKEAIQTLFSNSAANFMERLGLLMARGKDISLYRSAIEQVVASNLGKISALDTPGNESSKSNWKAPTLAWLLGGNWHKVEEFRSSYASPQEYAATMESVWTLLSFYWGAAAVWPRCSHQQHGGNTVVCGEPLLASASSKAICSNRFNGQQCGRAAVWSCHRRGHQDICSRCLQYQQAQLIGPAGPHSSTDIYDATVDRETDRREGTVFMLSSVTSRRPPKIAPNWKTSYRLQPSALVAIVKVGTPGQRIPSDSVLQWAEIVPVNPQDGLSGDWKCRQGGRMAVRLLSRGDCAVLSKDADIPLERRSHVAVIDLRVFVPEVISVLSTIASDAFVKHLSLIPFVNRLIGQNSDPSEFCYNSRQSVSENIQNAIESSEIDFIHRLDPDARRKIAAQILAIPQVQTLYGTQLEAFCGALSSSMHCTQGPPGTGKV